MAEGGHAMEEKGVRDRKREPEEYNFDYEELADAEVDSEQAGRRDDAVWETTCDTEDPYTVESEGMTWMTSTRGTGSASGSGHG